MQFDKLDKKIREAAERYHPVYDEQAWSSMENLLNKQMPEEKGNSSEAVLSLLFILLFIAFLPQRLTTFSGKERQIVYAEGSVYPTEDNGTTKVQQLKPLVENNQPGLHKNLQLTLSQKQVKQRL